MRIVLHFETMSSAYDGGRIYYFGTSENKPGHSPEQVMYIPVSDVEGRLKTRICLRVSEVLLDVTAVHSNGGITSSVIS